MNYLFTIVKSLFYKLVLLFVLLMTPVLFLIATTPGLYLSAKLAKLVLAGELHTENLEGRLIDDFSIGKLHYKNDKIDLKLENFSLQWRINALVHHQFLIKNIQASNAKILIKNDAEKPSLSFVKLPFDILIEKAAIDKIKLSKNNSLIQINHLNFQVKLTNLLWKISSLYFNFANTNFTLEAQAQPFLPYALSSKLQFNSVDKKAQGIANFGGDISLYHWHAEMNELCTGQKIEFRLCELWRSNPDRTLRGILYWIASLRSQRGDNHFLSCAKMNESTHLSVNGTLKDGKELHSLANWQNLVWPLAKNKKLVSPEGVLSLEGQLPELLISLNSTTTSPLAAKLQIKAETAKQSLHATGLVEMTAGKLNAHLNYNKLANPIIQGTITATSNDSKNSQLPISALQFNSEFKGETLKDLRLESKLSTNYFGHLLQGFLAYQNQQLKATLSLGKNNLELSGIPPYNWQIKAKFSEPQFLHPAMTKLQTTIDASASISNANKAKAILRIQPGSYRLSEAGPLTRLQFAGGQFTAQLNSQKLEINGKLQVDEQKTLTANLSLPQFQLNKGLQDSQKIQGLLNLNVNSLQFLEQFSTAISKFEGQLNASLEAVGTLKKPLLRGELTLDKARLLMTQLGIDLNPIQMRFQSRDKQWQAQGSAVSQGQVLHLNGNGNLAPKTTGTINIEADNFPLLKTDAYLINLSPKLVLKLSPSSIDLTGSILVPSAQIKPQTFNNTLSLSGDAIFVDNKPASPPNPLHINTDIQLAMGEKVALDVKGLQGFLNGAIRLRQLPQGPLTASGELRVREGKYQAYGQDLAIDQGELIFTGGLIDNPGINLRAIRRFNNTGSAAASTSQFVNFNSINSQTLDYSENTIVGILVTGRLKSPRIELFSEPSTLSQADILSMLILGKPISQANSAGGQLLLKAITSMNLGSGTRGAQLLEQLKQTLNLDVNFQTNAKFNQQTKQVDESNAVVVGKSLSKRIYLSYNFGLAQNDANVLTLTYLLNKFFSIQVNASTNASGIDLLYTHQKDKK